ncbi:50S ribosomal protein L3 [Betaproteobacteria bacterium]|nr:50S ribosomal protein L3 [Betaproteobacteria bacterium]
MGENVVASEKETHYKNTFGLIGTKVGMSRVFGADGASVPVTVIKFGLNVVSSLKSSQKHGYSAVQIGYKEVKKNKLNKPSLGYCAKLGIPTVSKLKEFRLSNEESIPSIGSTMSIDSFAVGEFVNVTGISKGKGYAGAIKRHGFSSQRTSHGNSVSHRAIGSTGMCQDPGRVFKGKKMSGHLGAVKRTTRNLKVIEVDGKNMLIMVKGSVPGNNGAEIVLKPSVKKKNKNDDE